MSSFKMQCQCLCVVVLVSCKAAIFTSTVYPVSAALWSQNFNIAKQCDSSLCFKKLVYFGPQSIPVAHRPH